MNKNKSRKATTPSILWEKLTWDDLSEWTDSRSLQRGRSYQRRGAVRNLNLLPDGGLLADVSGTHQYSTHVSFAGRSRDLSKRLESACSCPVGHRCKHGVAVILEFLDALEKGTAVSTTENDDRRLSLIENGWADEPSDEEDEEEENAPDCIELVTRKASSRAKKKYSRRQTRSKQKITDADIVAYLTSKRKEDLVNIIMQVCRNDAKLRQTYVDRIMLETGDNSAMIQEARQELRSVTSEEAWYNSWKGRGNLPNYSRLQSQLRTLVDAKQFESVIELGRELIERGTQQVEQSDDEGDTAGEITSTLSIVAKAIMRSSLTDADKLLFVIDSFLHDDYDLCNAFSDVLDQKHPKSAWADVAKNLKSRLPSKVALAGKPQPADFTESYQRERLSDWIIEALEAAGDEAAATNFCIKEATTAGSYQRAVNRLIAAKRYAEAKEIALQGLQATDPKYAGLTSCLQDSLATIAAKSKDYSISAAIAAERFIAWPHVSSFQDLQKAAKKAKCEPTTTAVAMRFLETGKPPVFAKLSKPQANKKKKASKPRTDCWPFTTPSRPSDTSTPLSRGPTGKPAPHFDVLIRLSIEQRDPGSILRWYDQWLASPVSSRFMLKGFRMSIADAVSSAFPDRAVELYFADADQLAAETQTKLYPQVTELQKKARTVLKSQKRGNEFAVILTTFRARHHRKHRLIEQINSISGKPIVNKLRINK